MREGNFRSSPRLSSAELESFVRKTHFHPVFQRPILLRAALPDEWRESIAVNSGETSARTPGLPMRGKFSRRDRKLRSPDLRSVRKLARGMFTALNNLGWPAKQNFQRRSGADCFGRSDPGIQIADDQIKTGRNNLPNSAGNSASSRRSLRAARIRWSELPHVKSVLCKHRNVL